MNYWNKKNLSTTVFILSLTLSSTSHGLDLTASSSNPKLTYDDLDSTGSDWDLAGYSDRFFILDQLNGKEVLKIFSSASNTENSVVIDDSGSIALSNNTVFIKRSASDGRLGIGTVTPEASLHIKSEENGNMILEYPGFGKWNLNTLTSGGFSIGNEFATTTPLQIDETAPTDSMRIGKNGVGIGLDSPTAKLDVAGDILASFTGVGNNLTELFKISANNTDSSRKSDAGFVIENARENFSWAFRTLQDNGGFAISKQGTGAKEFELRNSTTNDASKVELHLSNGGSNVNGSWLTASSRSYKKNIHELTTLDAITALRNLKSVTYQFKNDNEPKVGFIAEDVPKLVATKDRKSLDPMQLIAVLTKAVQEQDKALMETRNALSAKDQKIAKMEKRSEDYFRRLEKLESMIKRLDIK